MAFKNLRAAARAILNVVNSIPVPMPLYPYHAASHAAQEANLAYQRKERQAKAHAAMQTELGNRLDLDFFRAGTRTFPNAPGFAEALRNKTQASVERKREVLRTAMQTPPDFFPSENTRFVHRPGRTVKEIHFEDVTFSQADRDFFDTLERTMMPDEVKAVLVEPAHKRFLAYIAMKRGYATVNDTFYCIASDADAATKVLRLIVGGKIPNLYPGDMACRVAYEKQPMPMQGKYRMWEGKHNTCTPDGVYDVREFN